MTLWIGNYINKKLWINEKHLEFPSLIFPLPISPFLSFYLFFRERHWISDMLYSKSKRKGVLALFFLNGLCTYIHMYVWDNKKNKNNHTMKILAKILSDLLKDYSGSLPNSLEMILFLVWLFELHCFVLSQSRFFFHLRKMIFFWEYKFCFKVSKRRPTHTLHISCELLVQP